MKDKQGFTIVELLIVIVVIGVLAAISIVAFNGVTERSKDVAKLAEIKQFTKQLSVYRATNGEYPLAVPQTETALYAAHVAGSLDNNVDFVARQASMTAQEQYKLSAFETAYQIKVPQGVLYYKLSNAGTYFGDRKTTYVMSKFLNNQNIPEEYRSHRYNLSKGHTNGSFPQLVLYSNPDTCTPPALTPQTPLSNTFTGTNGASVPIINHKSDSVEMVMTNSYYSIPGCTGFVGYISDKSWGWVQADRDRKSGTGLFVLDQGKR